VPPLALHIFSPEKIKMRPPCGLVHQFVSYSSLEKIGSPRYQAFILP